MEVTRKATCASSPVKLTGRKARRQPEEGDNMPGTMRGGRAKRAVAKSKKKTKSSKMKAVKALKSYMAKKKKKKSAKKKK